jgi:glutamate dehydrogenase (NAD(P)+)
MGGAKMGKTRIHEKSRFFHPEYEIRLYDEHTDMIAYVVVNRRVPRDGRGAGGLRMDSNVSLEEVRRLAETMTYKWAIMGIAQGGAKSGIVADPSIPNKRDILKAFARLVSPLIKEQIYGMGVDMGITYADLDYIYKEIGTDPFTLAKERLKKQNVDMKIPEGITYETIGGEKF